MTKAFGTVWTSECSSNFETEFSMITSPEEHLTNTSKMKQVIENPEHAQSHQKSLQIKKITRIIKIIPFIF